MTRAIDTQQQEFTTRSHLAPLLLVVLTTYTDRAAETVDTIFYFSDRAIVYDYGNAGTDRNFWPLLRSLSSLRTSIDHVPDARATGLLSKPLTITLSNEEHQGARLINTLRNSHTLENATVEVAQILQERQSKPPVDLTALDGDEHTVLYQGVVERVATITDSEIVLQCTLDLPSVEYLIANDASITDPKDVGARLPIVYGAAKKIPCINYDVGFATTLAASIDEAASTLGVTGTTGFQSVGTGTLSGENISWGGKTATSLTSVMRGLGGTSAVQHRAGEVILETITTAKFVVAGHAVLAIQDLYVISPYNGELVRVTSAYTKNVADVDLISGLTVATAEFSAANLKALVAETAMQSDVTRDDTGAGLTTNPFVQEAIASSGGRAGDTSASENPDAVRDHIIGTENGTSTGDWPWREANLNNPITVTFADPAPSETVWEQRVHVRMREAFAATFDDIPVAAGPNRFGTQVALFSAASLPARDANPALFTSAFFTNNANQFTIWSPDEVIDVFEFWREIKTDGTIRSAIVTDQTPTSGSVSAGVGDSESLARDGNTTTKVRLDRDEWLQMNFPSTATYHEQKVRVLLGKDNEGDPNIVIHAGTISGPVVAELNVRAWGRTQAQGGEWIEFVTDEQTDSFTITTPGGNRIHIFEMERTVWAHLAPASSESNVDIEGANVGANLKMLADVDGYVSPPEVRDGYVFDNDTAWQNQPSGISVKATVRSRTARQFKGLDADYGTVVLDMDDDATNWTTIAGAVNSLDDLSTPVASGSTGCMGVNRSSAAGTQVEVQRTGLGSLDISDKVVLLALYNDNTNFTGDLIVRLGSSTVNSWSYTFAFTAGNFPLNTWVTLVIDPDASHTVGGSGLDETDWNVLQISVGGDLNTDLLIDNIRTVPRTVAMQKNDIANIDLTPMPAGGTPHSYEILPESAADISTAIGLGLIPVLFWSDDAGSGVVPPTNYKKYTFVAADFDAMVGGEWNTFDRTAAYTDVGSPDADLADVETFGMFWDWTAIHGPNLIDPMPDLTIAFEKLVVDDAGSSPFDAAPGALLEKPTDVLIHWIENIGGAVHDATSFATALTNLGADKWALDARTLGLTWPQVAARMQHGARSNLIPEVTATGIAWKLLQAESDYEWPAASGSIADWDRFVEAGRDLRELATRYRFPYGYNAALGIDETAWTALVVATPDQSDVSVSAAQLATAEATFGRFDAEPVTLPTILEEATAEEIAGYYVNEGIRLAALFLISGVPWWDAYLVEVGDLKNVTPPWASSSVKVRVIEYVKDWGTEQIELRCVEVV